MDLTDPVAATLLVAESFERASLSYALYGGLLLAAYGEPRETRDVDLAVIDASVDKARRALQKAGVETETNFEDVRFGGLVVDRIILVGGEETLGLNSLDLVRPRSARYRKTAVERAVLAPLRNRNVRVLTPEDFVLFKLLSTRDRDLADATSVLRRSGDQLDRSVLEREAAALGEEIPGWDVVGRLAELNARLSG